MPDAPPTRPSLLVRLRDPRDGPAWGQFVDLYAPLVYGYARKRGLQDADAADLTQTVLRKVAANVGELEYDSRRGSFRGWLFTIVRNQLRDFASRRRRPGQGSGDPAVHRLLQEQAAPTDDAAGWERDYRQRLLAWAAERVRPRFQDATWQAFWQTAVEGKRPREVAEALDLSAAAVYLARSRVMARLRAAIQELQED
jgi:RNA polymerase sigma factor (sigma-70 family)